MSQNKSRYRFWIGLAILLIIYSFYFLVASDGATSIPGITRHQRHLVLFVSIFAVYGAGTLFLSNTNPHWLVTLWHIIHLVLIPLLFALGMADWLMGGLPRGLRHFTQSIGETLVSPVLYVGIFLARNTIGKF
jgi:hypothetical protein